MTRTLIILSILFIFLGCGDIPNESLEPVSVDYKVDNISAPNKVIFSEGEMITTIVVIDRAETVKNVWFNLRNLNGSEEFSNQNFMTTSDEGSRRTYYGEYEFNQAFLPGNYEFSYYVEDAVNVSGENIRKIGTKQFKFLLDEDNVPPILNAVSVYETTPQGSRITISVRVIDSNGPDDINNVFFKLFDPQNEPLYYDEGNNIAEFPLLDDGTNGDAVKNNGIYSSYFTFPEDAELGTWLFQIGARDMSGASSETIERETIITENFSPEIKDLIIPIEIERGIEFIFSISASDPNGQTDIYLVYFELFRPDGSVVYLDEEEQITTFPMFDNGDMEGAGDEIENDGIYSLKNSFGESSQIGVWTFNFYAIDNSGTQSNQIVHNMTVN